MGGFLLRGLLQVGRKRPDADSDMDDAMSEESDEEWEDADHSDGVSSAFPPPSIYII